MASIELHGVEKTFAQGAAAALARVDLSIADGERLVLVGPSGSGKSTLLRIIAGLETPTTGRVSIDGEDVTSVPAERRDLAMVFQSYALYPHKSVFENLAFGLRVRRVGGGEIERRVRATAASLGIEALLDRRPSQLSGGQRQRVALGRAIVREPRAFLFDEPLSNLDPRLRGETRAELIQLHGRLRATMVYVTHDQEEAMTVGERIALLRGGAIEQVGTPDELYSRPRTTFTAQFIGSPPMNLLDPAALPDTVDARGAATVGVRPHDIRIVFDANERAAIDGVVRVVEPLGHTQIVRLDTAAGLLVAAVPATPPMHATDRIRVTFDPMAVHLFDQNGHRL